MPLSARSSAIDADKVAEADYYMAEYRLMIGDLVGGDGPDLAVANSGSDDVSVLLNLCTPEGCPWDVNDEGVVNGGEALDAALDPVGT